MCNALRKSTSVGVVANVATVIPKFLTVMMLVVLYQPLPSYIVQSFYPAHGLCTFTVTPATKTFTELIMGEIHILTLVLMLTFLVG